LLYLINLLSNVFLSFLVVMWLVSKIKPITRANFFNDHGQWHLPTDYEYIVVKDNDENTVELEDMNGVKGPHIRALQIYLWSTTFFLSGTPTPSIDPTAKVQWTKNEMFVTSQVLLLCMLVVDLNPLKAEDPELLDFVIFFPATHSREVCEPLLQLPPCLVELCPVICHSQTWK